MGNRRVALTRCSSSSKRRRGSSYWVPDLPEDVVNQIGWRVLAGDDGGILDFVRFRAVCRHWRYSTASPNGRGIADRRFHPRRWIMLPEGHNLHPGHGKLRGFIRFLNLTTGAIVRVHLPLFRDHCALDSVDGILLLQRDGDTAIRLLHPFTGDIAEFPPLDTLLPYVAHPLFMRNKWRCLRCVNAASISTTNDDNKTISLTMRLFGMVRVVFAAQGDKQWRLSTWPMQPDDHLSPLSFQGKIYVLRRLPNHGGDHQEILQIDPPQRTTTTMELSLPPPKLIAKCPAKSFHLVQCGEDIMVITLDFTHYPQMLVYRLSDLVLGIMVPVTCIGCDYSLFLGNRNLCVSSKAFPTIVGGTIVFYHNSECYLARYHIRSGTLSPKSDSDFIVRSKMSSPTGIIQHIYTCCFPSYWNKGHLASRREPNQWRVKRKWRHGVSLASGVIILFEHLLFFSSTTIRRSLQLIDILLIIGFFPNIKVICYLQS
uniref:KIB1-4 beta-propeller domain-containing protein n=1 Tax=Leersia perrieri TaxID=77586 RepID=A0A0D9XY11_9ORYZ